MCYCYRPKALFFWNGSVQRILLAIAALVIALCPWPLGSNREWSWNPLAVAVGLLLLATSVAGVRSPTSFSRTHGFLQELRLPSILVGIALIWALIQASGWTPEAWASSISAWPAIEAPSFPHAVAFDRDLVMVGLVHILTYVGVFLLAVVLPQTASEVRSVLGAIVISATIATLMAMVAMVLNRMSPYTGVSVWLPGQSEEFTATFINPNNYATYAGISALAALCLGIPAPSGSLQLTVAQRWRRRLLLISGKRGLWLAASMILMAGVLLSGSRGGAASLVASILVILVAYMRGPRRIAAVVLLLATVVLIGILLPGGERLMGRAVDLVERGESGRPLLYELTTAGIGLRPLLGWGLNSFADLYTVFQPISLAPLYDKAHNTYLELALDLGLPAAAVMVLAVAAVSTRCARGFATRTRDRELAMLGVAATVLVGLHALVDFSLQIPGMACTYFALLGLSWNQSWSSRAAAGKSKTSLRK